MNIRHFACAFVLSAAWTAPAFAQSNSTTPSDEADRLFAEAKTDAEAGRYAQACPKLEKSLQLDPAIGTEFNLADCHEHIGRIASAWTHYRNVEKSAHIAGKGEREIAAHARVVALKPKLAWLKLVPAPGTTLARLEVDGKSVALAADSPDGVPLDPGSRTISATSAAQDPFTETVHASAGQSITLHPFKDAKSKRPITIESTRGNTQRSVAIAVGAVGAVGLIVGGVTGIASVLNNSSAKKLGNEVGCGDPTLTCHKLPEYPNGDPDKAASTWTRATTFGTVSTIGFVVGGVSAAAAIVLWVTAPKHGTSTSTAGVHWDARGLHF